MAALDSEIDALYQKPLEEFTAARNALAKTLKGEDAARVKKLPKPTVVPWVVNQLYWHARPIFDRLRTAGERLRAAQIAALKGRGGDIRAASDAQRKAIADAVQRATALAGDAGSRPGADELTRTLEALSLAAELPEEPGRLTRPLQPAGFEALAGVPIRAKPAGDAGAAKEGPAKAGHHKRESAGGVRLQADRDRDRERLEGKRRAESTLHQAEAALDRSKAAEAQARAAWERARDQLKDAERSVAEARKALKD